MARVVKKHNVHYVGQVHDLCVANTHTYNVEGLAVHNSAAGSLVSYCLGLTDLDPIKYKLLFERFLDYGRKGISVCTFEV
jgi:DNA polymerase-3 subunit alpha